MNKHNQNGFAGLHLLLILIVVVVIGVVGWYIYNTNAKANKSLNSTIKTSDNITPNISKKTGSNVIPSPVNSTTMPSASTTPQSAPSYSNFMNITEWGVKVPTNSQYMGYRWDITDDKDNLVSIFISDDTNGLSKNVGCSMGDIQGVYVYKDLQYSDYNSDSNAVMPDANLNVGGHVYYVYKTICQGRASSSVENLANKVDLMSLK